MENENKSLPEVTTYDFDVINIIKKGWASIDGVKGQFMVAFIIYGLISFAVGTILGMIFPQGSTENPNVLNQIIVSVISIPVIVPLFVGMYMMAIHHVRGEEIEFKSMFNYYHLTGVLSLATLAMYSLLVLGFVLLILPGLYLSIAYVFTLPLIADKGMGIWEAMEYSRKKVTQHWFKVFGLVLLLSLIMFVGMIPLGIGLVWTLPLMFVTLYGLLYAVIFDGVEV